MDGRDDATVGLSDGLILDVEEVGDKLDLIKDHVLEPLGPFLLVGSQQVDLEHPGSANQDVASVDVPRKLGGTDTDRIVGFFTVTIVDMSQHLVGEGEVQSHKNNSALHRTLEYSWMGVIIKLNVFEDL